MCEQLTAFNDFGNRLIKGDGLPLVFAALASPLEHLLDAEGVVSGLHASLALGTERGIHFGHIGQWGGIGNVRYQVPGRIGVAFNLDRHTIQDLNLNPALGVALLADGVNLMVGVSQNIGRTFLCLGKSIGNPFEAAQESCCAAGNDGELEKIGTRNSAVFRLHRGIFRSIHYFTSDFGG